MKTLLALLHEPWRSTALRIEATPAELASALDEATRVCVDPIVARRILAQRDVDGPTRQRAFEVRASSVLLHKAAWRHLERTAGALERVGVRALAFKGAVFAELAFEDPASRISNDLDFLVPREDVRRAVLALEGLGYTRVSSVADVDIQGGVELRSENLEQPTIDLHATLTKPLLGARLTPFEGTPRLVNGIATLDAAWTIAAAAVQLHQDVFGLKRIVDLAAILSRSTEDEATRALEIATELGIAGVLQAGAQLARALGTPDRQLGRPSTVIQRSLARRSLASFVNQGLAPTSFRENVDQLVHGWLLLDSPGDAVRVASRLAFPPRDYVRRRGGQLRRLASFARRLLP